jgi:hypothetical protein
LQLARTYQGLPRIIVPTVRTLIEPGESLTVKAIILLPGDPESTPRPAVELYWRPLGKGKFARLPVKHVARGVFEVKLPPYSRKTMAIEYYIRATSGTTTLLYPPTAPALNQTVVVGKLGQE